MNSEEAIRDYIYFASQINGNTTVVYEGKPVGTPDAGAFWRVIRDHVSVLFTALIAIRDIKRDDPKAEMAAAYDMSKFRTLFWRGSAPPRTPSNGRSAY